MHINTYSTLFGLFPRIMWAPADDAGADSGGDVSDAGNTGDDTSGDGEGTQTTETALGGEVDGEKPEDKTALGNDADGADNGDEDGEDSDDDNADDTVPEDGVYDFGEMPDGIEIDDASMKAWSESFKELGLTTKQAKGLAQMRAAEALAQVESNTALIEARQTEHLEAAKTDADIGGDKWDDSVRLANLGMKALGGEAIRDLILQTGNGNNVEMVRELRRIGEMVKDDTFEDGSQATAPTSPENTWYGDTTPETKKG